MEEIHHPFKTARGTSIFIALLTFCVTLIGLRTSGVRSFEGWLYDWFFLVCASVLSSLLILVGWHFFRCWYLLSIILEQLGDARHSQSFHRVAGHVFLVANLAIESKKAQLLDWNAGHRCPAGNTR